VKKILWTLDQLSDDLTSIWTQPSIDIGGTMGFAFGMAKAADDFM
jgi:hypothetical protein